MTGTWVALPVPPILVSRADPYLVAQSQVQALEAYFESRDAAVVSVEVSSAHDEPSVVGALKSVLPFPDWCGSGWDSMEDAYEELRQAWTFPLVLLVHGTPALVSAHPQVALQTVVRLSDFTRAFSSSGEQLVVVYEW